jgi:hypothetical protein
VDLDGSLLNFEINGDFKSHVRECGSGSVCNISLEGILEMVGGVS